MTTELCIEVAAIEAGPSLSRRTIYHNTIAGNTRKSTKEIKKEANSCIGL
jgi:hypothetical protein